MDRKPLEGRHALVTGGGAGIGLAVALALSKEVASVAIASRAGATLGDAAGKFGFHAETLDVTDPESVGSATESAFGGSGPVDIRVAKAGIAESMPFAETTGGF